MIAASAQIDDPHVSGSIAGASASQRFLNRSNQQLINERFAYKRHGASGERLLSDADVIVGRDKNDGKRFADSGKVILNGEAAHSRHLHIQNQTIGTKRRHGLEKIEKILPRAECLCIHGNRPDESS